MKKSIITGIILILFSSLIHSQKEDGKNLLNGIYQTSETGIEMNFYNLDKKSLKIDSRIVVSYLDVARVESYIHAITNETAIKLYLTDVGRKNFEMATRENLGKPLAIVANGHLLSAPTVGDVISSGTIEISCSRTDLIEKAIQDFKSGE